MPIQRTSLVIATFAVLTMGYFLSITGSWHLHSDSAMYVGLSRSLLEGRGYTFNHAPHVKYPPVFPVMLIPFVPREPHDVWGMQALGALCAITALLLVYLLVRPRVGVAAALAVVAGGAMCTWFQLHAVGYVLSGVPYAMWAFLAVFRAEREAQSPAMKPWRWMLVGLLATVAILTHMSGVSLLPAIAAAALFARGQTWRMRHRLLAAGIVLTIGGAVTGCWTLRSLTQEKRPGYDNLVKQEPKEVLDEPLAKLSLRLTEWGSAPFGLKAALCPPAVGVTLFIVLALPGIVWAFYRYRGTPEFYLICYFLVVLFYGGQGSRERYVVPVLPLLFYYIYETARLYGRGLLTLGQRVAGGWLVERGPAVCSAAVGAFALAFCGLGIYQRFAGRGATVQLASQVAQRRSAYFAYWKRLNQLLDIHVPKDAVLFAGCGGEEAFVHYFTGRHTGYYLGQERGMQILRRMADQDAAFVLVEKRKATYGSMLFAIRDYVDCFEIVFDRPNNQLYRVRKSRLKQTVAEATRR